MNRLREEMAEFFGTVYADEPRRLVFGEGDEHARIVLIGEAPGEQETRQGRPFVGKAGKNLDEFLALSGLDRRTLYITNTVKFRPTRVSDTGRIVNRPPTREEIKLSLPWLLKEIRQVEPEIVVTLGNVPLKALAGSDKTVGECHGGWMDWEGVRLYPLYHPASIIYNRALKPVYEQDVVRLGEEVRKCRD